MPGSGAVVVAGAVAVAVAGTVAVAVAGAVAVVVAVAGAVAVAVASAGAGVVVAAGACWSRLVPSRASSAVQSVLGCAERPRLCTSPAVWSASADLFAWCVFAWPGGDKRARRAVTRNRTTCTEPCIASPVC